MVSKPLRPWKSVFGIALLISLLDTSSILAQRQNPSNAPVDDGIEVTGLALTESGQPVAGADVYLLRRGTYYGRMDPRKVQTDVAGFFKFDRVADGEYRLWAIHGNLISRQQRTQWQIITATKASAPELAKLTMRPGRLVHATVVSAADGKPVPGAIIRLPRNDPEYDFPLDANGRRTIDGLTAELWEIQAIAPSKARVVKTVNLSNDIETSIDFTLDDGGSIGGRITDATGINP